MKCGETTTHEDGRVRDAMHVETHAVRHLKPGRSTWWRDHTRMRLKQPTEIGKTSQAIPWSTSGWWPLDIYSTFVQYGDAHGTGSPHSTQGYFMDFVRGRLWRIDYNCSWYFDHILYIIYSNSGITPSLDHYHYSLPQLSYLWPPISSFRSSNTKREIFPLNLVT